MSTEISAFKGKRKGGWERERDEVGREGKREREKRQKRETGERETHTHTGRERGRERERGGEKGERKSNVL